MRISSSNVLVPGWGTNTIAELTNFAGIWNIFLRDLIALTYIVERILVCTFSL